MAGVHAAFFIKTLETQFNYVYATVTYIHIESYFFFFLLVAFPTLISSSQ